MAMTERWRRPYGPGLFRIVAGTFVVFGLGFFALVTWRMFLSIDWETSSSPVAAAGIWLFMGGCLAFAWRLFAAGVYVSTRGLRIRNVTSTRTLTWSEVDSIYLDDLRYPGVGRSHIRARAIWIKPKNASAVQTVLNDMSAEFLWRRRAFHNAYERLVDAHHEASSP
jgi:hypothetical protein